MKALLVNPQTSSSLWNFPEGCKILGKKSSLIPLSIVTVAAMLPDSWEIRLVDMEVEDLSDDDLEWADVALITGMGVQMESINTIISRAKEKGLYIVGGGPFANSFREDLLRIGIDLVVIGELENQSDNLVRSIENRLSEEVLWSEEKPDMEESPIPRFELLKHKDYGSQSIQTSRGCPFNCEFCDITHHYGNRMRHKTPAQVVKELEYLYSMGVRGHIFIADDNFIGSRKAAVNILKEIIKFQDENGEPFSFGGQASLNLGNDLELIDLMTKANFGEIFIGVESPEEEALFTAKKYQNIKNTAYESVENLKRNGILVTGSFIIGLDEEKKGVGERICELVEATSMPFVMVNLLAAIPGTQLWNRLKQEGRLIESDANKYKGFDGLELNYAPKRPTKEILEEYVRTWDRLYNGEAFLKRCYKYFQEMRPTRSAMGRDTDQSKVVSNGNRRSLTGRECIDGFMTAGKFIWKLGIRQRTRRQFWKQMIDMKRANPSRLNWYLSLTARQEDMMRIRMNVMNSWERMNRAN